jgi:hypothetical protein
MAKKATKVKKTRRKAAEKVIVPKVKKHYQELPNEVVTFFKKNSELVSRDIYISVLREKGWTLQSIADAYEKATKITMTRERVRQICLKEFSDSDFRIFKSLSAPIPELPMHPLKEPKVYNKLSPETVKQLLKLQKSAQLVRSSSQKYRKEAEEYTSLIWENHTKGGVSLFSMAKQLGVTHGAIRFRLIRYGYKKSNKSDNKVYQPIIRKNRYKKQA